MNDNNNKSVNEFFLVNLFFLVELSYGGKALLGTLKFFSYVAFTRLSSGPFDFLFLRFRSSCGARTNKCPGGERRSIARLKNSLAKHTNACTRARISITLLASHHREKPVLK